MGNQQSGTQAAISLPKGGGAIKGIGETFQPDLFTGTGNFSIPIATTPGRNGFGPKINLQYSTGNGSSPFGLGWNLSIPRVSRKTEKGLPRYDGNDIFLLSGAEDLVKKLDKNGQEVELEPSGPYRRTLFRPRTEGLFARIELWENTEEASDLFWKITTKDNSTNIYGKSTSARIADPKDQNRIFEWLLEETYDAKGNHILYEYQQDYTAFQPDKIFEQNRQYTQTYIKRILYGNTPRDLPKNKQVGHVRESTHHQNPLEHLTRHYLFEVLFDYGDIPEILPVYDTAQPAQPWWEPKEDGVSNIPSRKDAFSVYRSGFEIRTLRRCHRVLMLHHFNEDQLEGTPLVKSTNFSYKQDPYSGFSVLKEVTQWGYRKDAENNAKYIKRSLPPITFEYSKFLPEHQTFESVQAEGGDMPPLGLEQSNMSILDIFGNGLPDLVQSGANGFNYWENQGEARISSRYIPKQTVPADTFLGAPNVTVADLGGDGLPDLIKISSELTGFYEATTDGGWQNFKQLENFPNLDLSNPNVQMVDLTGDGLSDILITEDTHFQWYKSLGEAGYEPQSRINRVHDLQEFPDVFFSDPRVRLADMSGDGLNDIVLIHSGRVDYWPNLGYGHFGKRITMGAAPKFDYAFDPSRLFLVDLDGTGCADLVYVELDRVSFLFNQSGNNWSEEHTIIGTPYTTNIGGISFSDFYGTGTACLIWSYPYGSISGSNYKVLDFCGKIKPHLLIEMDNNMGATTRVQYASSTKFYLEDKKSGTPWITNLPFPIHVVEKTEIIDHISKTKLVTKYKYHHGYFDGREREFRGFGRVDQYDTEEFESFTTNGLHDKSISFENNREAFHIPTVLTKSWFHVGIHFDENFSQGGDQFYDYSNMLEAYMHEYYQSDELAFQLENNSMPDTESLHEAYRSLRGSLLRTEVFALDDSYLSKEPYAVVENRYEVKELQAKASSLYPVFMVMPRESIDYSYERNPLDPRIVHEITVDYDHYGNLTESISISYPRRPQTTGRFTSIEQIKSINGIGEDTLNDIYYSLVNPRKTIKPDYQVLDFFNHVKSPDAIVAAINDDPHFGLNSPKTYGVRSSLAKRILETRDALLKRDSYLEENAISIQQQQTKAIYSITRFINNDTTDDSYYIGVSFEEKVFEVHGLNWEWPDIHHATNDSLRPFTKKDFDGVKDPLEFEPYYPLVLETFGEMKKRLVDWKRNYFLKNEGSERVGANDALPLGEIDSLGLPYQSYQIAFTKDLLEEVYGEHLNEIDLNQDGGYSNNLVDPLNPGIDENNYWWIPSGRTTYDPNKYHSINKAIDPFEQRTIFKIDEYGLLVEESTGPLSNSIKVKNNYRVLQPYEIIDPNANISQVAYDALSMVVATAIGGEDSEGNTVGDSLDGLKTDLSTEEIVNCTDNPYNAPEQILKKATSRIVYDLHRYQRTNEPNVVYSLNRESHVSAVSTSKIQHSFVYSDGFGREVQSKIQAESLKNIPFQPRWVGSGTIVFNNKGKPVQKYEPFFSDTHVYSIEQHGVSSTIFYDPQERAICTINPNNTFEKIVFNPWRQEVWDSNDTILIHPAEDTDIRGYVEQFLDSLESNTYVTWYDKWIPDRGNKPQNPTPEQRAALISEHHANTPTINHFDTLGRVFLSVANNGKNEFGHDVFHFSHKNLDIEGNAISITAPRQYELNLERSEAEKLNNFVNWFDLAGRNIRSDSIDAGSKWTFTDVFGESVTSFDTNKNVAKTKFDSLRRPIELWVKEANTDFALHKKFIYGEDKTDAVSTNHRLKVWKVYDGAGLELNAAYNFKGNLIKQSRVLLSDGKTQIQWPLTDDGLFDEEKAVKYLQEKKHETSSSFDALNRIIWAQLPDGTIQEPSYNEANLLDSIHVTFGGGRNVYVKNIEYNAKGQRKSIHYGNDIITKYIYDQKTHRLTNLSTARKADSATYLQLLQYCYDPVGNITSIRDDAHQNIFNNNHIIEPESRFKYDALYQLIKASGREHEAMSACHYQKPDQKFSELFGLNNQPVSNGKALCNYERQYQYDKGGNILQIQHKNVTKGTKWVRKQQFDLQSNRITSSRAGCQHEDIPLLEQHDFNGNIKALSNLPQLHWNYRNELIEVQLNVGKKPNKAYYQYDSRGQRVRKVIQKGGKLEERIYLGGYEIYTETGISRNELRRDTIHVLDDQNRIALIEAEKTLDTGSLKNYRTRYQLANQIGSSTLEADGTPNAQIISYEEYYPFGGSAYLAGANVTEVKRKRYRYSGKERDDETGLYYYGARYFVPWMSRWLNTDPIGLKGGGNLYLFVKNNPINRADSKGLQDSQVDQTTTDPKEWGIDINEPYPDDPSKKEWADEHTNRHTQNNASRAPRPKKTPISLEDAKKTSDFKKASSEFLTRDFDEVDEMHKIQEYAETQARLNGHSPKKNMRKWKDVVNAGIRNLIMRRKNLPGEIAKEIQLVREAFTEIGIDYRTLKLPGTRKTEFETRQQKQGYRRNRKKVGKFLRGSGIVALVGIIFFARDANARGLNRAIIDTNYHASIIADFSETMALVNYYEGVKSGSIRTPFDDPSAPNRMPMIKQMYIWEIEMELQSIAIDSFNQTIYRDCLSCWIMSLF